MPLIFVCELLCQDFLVALENLTLVALAPDKCRSDQQRERYANDCESNDADFQAFFTHGLFWQDWGFCLYVIHFDISDWLKG